jgi:hypothetical protein
MINMWRLKVIFLFNVSVIRVGSPKFKLRILKHKLLRKAICGTFI